MTQELGGNPSNTEQNRSMGMKRVILIFLSVMMLCTFTGCGSGRTHYSSKEAKQHIEDWLSNKYGEEFEILEITKKKGSNGPLPGDKYYVYKAKSISTGIEFGGRTSYSYKKGNKDDYFIWDTYEEDRYKPLLEEEIAAIDNNFDNWGTWNTIVSAFYSNDMDTASTNYDSFKADPERVSISINLNMNRDYSDEVLLDVYEYVKQVHDINKNVDVAIRKTDKSLLTVNLKDIDSFDYDSFCENIKGDF